MDTIVLVHSYPATDPSAVNYEMLSIITPPHGCKAWITSLNGGMTRCCFVKVNCHDIGDFNKATKATVGKLTRTVNSWLGGVGLSVDDFVVSRIDYDYNCYLSSTYSEAIMEAMQQLPTKTMHLDKASFPDSSYYASKSRHAQWYSKDRERKAKGQTVKPRQVNQVRQEVQCHSRHIKYVKRQYGLERSWDNWVNTDREAYYLTNAKPIFPPGDFYTVNAAAAIIQASNLTPHYKRKLIEALELVRAKGMQALYDGYSRNTVKTYLSKLAALGINPLPLHPKFGLDTAPNPFRKNSKGGQP